MSDRVSPSGDCTPSRGYQKGWHRSVSLGRGQEYSSASGQSHPLERSQPLPSAQEVLRCADGGSEHPLHLARTMPTLFEFRQERVAWIYSAQCLRGGLDLLWLCSKPPLVTRPADKRRLYLRHFHLPI